MATSLDEAFLDITDICKERGINSGEVSQHILSTFCMCMPHLVFVILNLCFSVIPWRRLLKNSEPLFMKRLVLHVVLGWDQTAYLLRFCWLFHLILSLFVSCMEPTSTSSLYHKLILVTSLIKNWSSWEVLVLYPHFTYKKNCVFEELHMFCLLGRIILVNGKIHCKEYILGMSTPNRMFLELYQSNLQAISITQK